MKKYVFFIMAMLLPTVFSFSQSVARAPLSVGDTVPDFLFTDINNYKASSCRLSAFEKELVIIDFWATWCGSCISKFPSLDRLQHSFGSIQILLLNNQRQTSEKVGALPEFIDRYKKEYPSSSLAFVNENSQQLRYYFPFQFLPHYVWLDRNRKIVAITDAKEVTAKNIDAFLQDRHFHLPEKTDKHDLSTKTTAHE